MKLLENAQLEAMSMALSGMGDCRIEARVESYSCKMAGNDKRLFKAITSQEEGGYKPTDLQALSPPQTMLSLSPNKGLCSRSMSDEGEGYLCDTINTKTLFYLISTLNASFNPDYDFSSAKSAEFSKEPSLQFVTNTIDSQLAAVSGYGQFKQQLWSSINDEISLPDCEIYSYNPDLSSDPFAEEGAIWSFNFFFYNKKMKRLLFFNCRCTNPQAGYDSGYVQNESFLGDEMDNIEYDRDYEHSTSPEDY